MLKKRIIPCLDIKEGRAVKGVNFTRLRDAGNPVELAEKYIAEGADELVFLDITATLEKRRTLIEMVEKIAEAINIPFTVGGGINTVEDAAAVIKAGADKVSVNSAAVKKPELIADLAARFGSQCVVVAVDIRNINGTRKVYINSGKTETCWEAAAWVKKAEELGAGEVLLTSMDKDGTTSGFDIEGIQYVSNAVNIPVIASGGAGEKRHFSEVFSETKASGGLAASIFHFGEISIHSLKNYLKEHKIPIR